MTLPPSRFAPCLVVFALIFAACGEDPADSKRAPVSWQAQGLAAPVCAAGPTLQGIDVSHYQGTIDWAQVAAAGITFAYTKATEGTSYQDPSFAANWSGMQAHGVRRGAYHFFHPGTDGKQQADAFLALVGTLGAGDLPPMLDWETSDGVSGGTATANAQAFINEIAARTGKQTIIYNSPGVWPGYGATGFGGNALWVAEYYNCGCDTGVCPSPTASWSNWLVWQYSSTGDVPGVSGNVDRDIFNGDLAALDAFAGGSGGTCTNPNAIGHPIGGGGKVSGPCGSSAPPVTAPTACGAIASGQGLGAGGALQSCDGRFQLAMQTDGNLVVYAHGNALFDTHTNGNGGAVLEMQGDGNLVMYSAAGCAIWNSATGGHAGARLALQDDGNAVIYDTAGHALWSSGTGPVGEKVTGCGRMQVGSGLVRGDSVSACGGCFSLQMQGDGNLVLYKNGAGALWSSGTAGTAAYTASMQSDGNLVIYAATGCPLWQTHTGGHAGATLSVQDDGNLVVYDGNIALWNSSSVSCSGGCTCNPPATTSASSTGTTGHTSTTTGTTGATTTTGTTGAATTGAASTSSAASTTGGTPSSTSGAGTGGDSTSGGTLTTGGSAAGSTSTTSSGHESSGASGSASGTGATSSSGGRATSKSGGCGCTSGSGGLLDGLTLFGLLGWVLRRRPLNQ